MRITNAMMTNTTLLHLNRNMRNLDEIIRQIETTKRIGTPSDNPIVASRALKFRTGVVENEVFQGNVRSAQAWMNVTDAAMTNINSELMLRFRQLLVGAATGTYNTPLGDKHAIITQIQSLFDELTTNINQTMAGRYVFSGLRTDEPPVFRQANDRSFVITQNFTINDVMRTNTFQRVPRDGDHLMDTRVHQNVSIINLAYNRITTQPELGPSAGTPEAPWRTPVENPQGIHIPGFHIRKVSIDDPQAYIPVATTADLVPPVGPPYLRVLHLVAETGELVMHADTAANFPSEGISVTYKKTGFRPGELNPAVYFDAREIIDPADPADSIERVFRLTQHINRNNADNYTPGLPPPLVFEFTIVPTPSFDNTAAETGLRPILPDGVVLVGNTLTVPAHVFQANTNITISFCVIDPDPNDPAAPHAPLPTHIKQNLHFTNVELVRAQENGIPVPLDQADPNRSFNMNNQDLEFEFATRTHVPINHLAKNILTDKMFADFRRLFEFSNALRISTPESLRLHYNAHYTSPPYSFSGNQLEAAVQRAVEAQISKEETDATGALYHVINNMLLVFDRHASQSLREQTILGSRMVRMELLESRLEQDEVTLRDLQSSNEDTDMIRAIILRMSAEAAFMASLQANSGIVQMSLANFIRI